MSKTYFTTDGSYGDAEGLVIVDTTTWGSDEWEFIQNLPDGQRAEIAEDLSYGKGALGVKECHKCEFAGIVYVDFDDPDLEEDGGYSWECPECGSEHVFEGVQS